MRLSHDLGLRSSAPISSNPPWIKRSEHEEIEILLRRNYADAELDTGDKLRFTLAALNDPSTELVNVELVVADLVADSGGLYRTTFSSVTAPVNTILGVGGTIVPLVRCDGEIAWWDDSEGKWQPGDTFPVDLKIGVINVSSELSTIPGDQNAGYWTSYTGGSARYVDAIVTVSLPLNHTIETAINGIPHTWQLQEWDGEQQSDVDAGYILPLDADDPDNMKIWVQIE